MRCSSSKSGKANLSGGIRGFLAGRSHRSLDVQAEGVREMAPAARRRTAAAAMRGGARFSRPLCKDPTYRPVHAERFLSQRRFDGFNEKAIKQKRARAAEDAGLRAEWGGHAEPLVRHRGAEIPGLVFRRQFDAGPPVTIKVQKPFAATGSAAITAPICRGCSGTCAWSREMRRKQDEEDNAAVETPAKISPAARQDRNCRRRRARPRASAGSTGCNGWPITTPSAITSCLRGGGCRPTGRPRRSRPSRA